EDPDVLEFTHSISGVFGPFEGGLSNRGENVRLVDRWNNLVDEVRYHDGGDWDLWADGGGASLELIDPNQVNDFGSAWAASDESEKASWAQYSYSVPDYRTGAESELKLFLVERGISLIDDVSVRRGNGSNHIPNSGFESSTSGWRIEGTHILSRRVTWDARSGNACLEINATGKGDSSVNRIEVDTSPSLSRGSYEVSFWARWLRGASVVVGHGVFTSGPWGGRPGPSVNSSGNTLGGHVRLNVPTNLGTPGAENSARRNLRESSGSSNLGPVFANVLHSPASPDEDDEVVVSAIVSDADDVDEVEVRFREGDANGSFQTREMSVVPNSGGLLYSARLPRFSRNRKVVFWLEATDGAGRTRRYPENAPDRTLLFQTSGPNSSSLESTAIILDDARNSELGSRRVHSNHLLDATFVMDDRRVYYNVGVRYRGSPWGRPERTNYRVRFQKDQPTYSGLRAVNLSSRANGPVEAASYFLIGRSGTPEKPVSYPIYRFVASRVNGSSRGVTRLIQVVDGSYLDRWFPGSDGPAYKAVARLGFNDGGQRVTYDGASYDYMDRSPENYRFYYYPITDRSRDDWESLSELMRVMDPSATSNTVHDQLIDQILDLEGFLRVMVPRVFVSDWDTLGIGQGHNAYLVQDTNDGLYETIAFDLNQAMPGNQVKFPVFPNFDRGWTRLISRPRARRLYARIALEFMDGYWSVPRANAFLSQMEDDVGISMNEVRSFIPARANIMRPQIAAFDNFDLEITTGGGDDIDTKSSSITLRGEAPASIATIVYQRNREESAEVDVVWETPNRWRARFDLPSSTNEFDFFGFATDGSLIDSTGITVNNLSVQGDRFTRGDANFDDVVDLSDALEVLLGLFGGQDIACPDAADADDSGAINITDAVHILQFLFQGGSAPATPFPQDGEDPTEDALICRDEV
ncbi:MAG: CotH kinase family protein, partial [Planctomycetota bacterium]